MKGSLDVHPKVVASSVSGALTVCILYVIDKYGHVVLPPEVGGAVTILVASACSWLAPLIPGEKAPQ